jgi:RNA-binding protein
MMKAKATEEKEKISRRAPPKHPMDLGSGQRKFLRGLGHALNPLLQVGKEGITDGVLAQLMLILRDHELVKVKLLQNATISKGEATEFFSSRLDATLVQQIGKTFLFYAPHPDEPVIQLPRAKKKKKTS